MTTNGIWLAILISSVVIFIARIIGYNVPSSILEKERLQRITTLIPIVLLAALVGSQTMVKSGEVVIDHRLAGLLAGAIALRLKGSFLVVLVVAGLTGALVYNFIQ
ncbi:MAG: AzlD domain-containing protein [Actinomycetota bacterium]